MVPAIVLTASGASAPAERVQLSIATLHAAALTTPRAAGDSTDTPFFVMEVSGPHASTASILPESAQVSIRRDEALAARPLTELSLSAGDSIQVLVSVLEHSRTRSSTDVGLVAPLAKAHGAPAPAPADQATRLVAPLVKEGAHWLGSVSLLMTNEGGAIYWRRLDCVASCKVLTAPAATALPAPTGQPFAGIVEFSGNGGTYHLALRASRTP
jgi:hypothetical protein